MWVIPNFLPLHYIFFCFHYYMCEIHNVSIPCVKLVYVHNTFYFLFSHPFLYLPPSSTTFWIFFFLYIYAAHKIHSPRVESYLYMKHLSFIWDILTPFNLLFLLSPLHLFATFSTEKDLSPYLLLSTFHLGLCLYFGFLI